MTTTKRTNKGNNSGAVAEIDWTATFVEALNAPGSLGNTYNRFYNYSFLNQIRLLMQGVHEPVATYRRWSELGFQVQKGSKAKVVLAPIVITKKDPNTGKPLLSNTGQPQRVLVGFRDSRTVFTFSDTDGDELPPVDVPAWDADKALDALNVKRRKFRELSGNTQGYSYVDEKTGEQRIALNPAAKYPHKTLFHELAHLVLGHCKAMNDGHPVHRGIAEFEAESTAYIVAKELELTDWDASESRAYIQQWLDGHWEVNEETGEGEIENLDKHMSRIFSAANKILTAGRTTAESE
jgi:hypothetical protein